MLSPLTDLAVLKVYLDLENTPKPSFEVRPYDYYGAGWAYDEGSFKEFTQSQHGIAETIARNLGPSIKDILLWSPKGNGALRHIWVRFQVDHCYDDTGIGSTTTVTRRDDLVYADILGV